MRELADTGLPVERSIEELRMALGSAGCAVLQAETGAGKSTVVPLRLLSPSGTIIMLEPRRLAARMAAKRMASLIGEPVGQTVGYASRDDTKAGPDTKVLVVTEGVLVRRMQSDPELTGVALVIFDEFHERSLQGDLALAMALDVRDSLRPDLGLLVMSATLDDRRIAELLGRAGEPSPIVSSSGRTFPVEIRWAEPDLRPQRAQRPWDDLERRVAATVRRAVAETDGTVLVFLPGLVEINRVAKELRSTPPRQPARVLPLHGSFASADQDAAVAPPEPGERHVVLSTDVAETSITVEAVTAVVDAGVNRRSVSDPRTGISRLETVVASRASAAQRAGRAGRVRPGVAYRLWTEAEHMARPAYTEPEILTAELSGFVLSLRQWGVAEPTSLQWIDPPPSAAVTQAERLLAELDALDSDGALTALGRSLDSLGTHPRLGRILVKGIELNEVGTAAALAALLSDRDVFDRRAGVDIAPRVAALLDGHSDLADRRALAARSAEMRRLMSQARRIDPARKRRNVTNGGAMHDRVIGRLALAGFPDRLAQRTGDDGRFRLAGGSAASVDSSDPTATERLVVALDVEGHRHQARVRLAAGVTAAIVQAERTAHITETVSIEWDPRGELVEIQREHLGAVDLARVERRPEPGEAVAARLLERFDREGAEALRWTKAGMRLRQQVAFLNHSLGDPWPDVADDSLAALLRPQVEIAAQRMIRWSELRALDAHELLRRALPGAAAYRVDELAPAKVQLANGRSATVDWADENPSIALRAQDLYGLSAHPTVADGSVRLAVTLLSPAGRPIQTTSDLPRFWAGTWADVRKEMVGRYPKHDWPIDPAASQPGGARRSARRATDR